MHAGVAFILIAWAELQHFPTPTTSPAPTKTHPTIDKHCCSIRRQRSGSELNVAPHSFAAGCVSLTSSRRRKRREIITVRPGACFRIRCTPDKKPPLEPQLIISPAALDYHHKGPSQFQTPNMSAMHPINTQSLVLDNTTYFFQFPR